MSLDADLNNSNSFKAKSKWYKPKKVTKLALNSQLLTVQILTNDVQVLILCLSYFITTVKAELRHYLDEMLSQVAVVISVYILKQVNYKT